MPRKKKRKTHAKFAKEYPKRKPYILVCQVCGAEFEARSKETKYCPECRSKIFSQYAKERNISQKSVEARRRYKEEE